MSGIKILRPGMLSLLQDGGRIGQHRIGLTNGGPIDAEAFNWANRLCDNPAGATAIELSIGGLAFEVQQPIRIAVTGAVAPLTVNSQPCEQWRSYHLRAGDQVEIGFTTEGMRVYLAVAGGFKVSPRFGSTSTVVREGVGGLCGKPLQADDQLECIRCEGGEDLLLPVDKQPRYQQEVVLRTVLGYQQAHFSPVQQALFFSSSYEVSDNCDRMGYRLKGRAIKGDIEGILSEGICHGAIQIPADGQPIVLMNDRQTIGGYPKIGSVIALDTAKLGQLAPGGKVSFEQISMEQAHNINTLARSRFLRTEPQVCQEE